MKDDTFIIIFALACLMVLEIVALCLGVDGAMLATVIGIFGAAVGYKVKALKKSGGG